MSVQRRYNVISQVRVETSDIKAVESAVSADFDTLVQAFINGQGNDYVITGFEINWGSAIGASASSLLVNVSNSAILHPSASQSGTFYLVPTGTSPVILNAAINTNVTGAFVQNALNYVGIDYYRYNDASTDVQRYIWDPTTDDEDTLVAPAATIMDFEFVITTIPWANNVLPIAVVQTNNSNIVTSITDARNMIFRLGTGGANPNPFYVYPWNAQPEGRSENPPTSSSNGSNPFEGGDKMLTCFKDWADAIMTSILQIQGTTYWYSANTGGSILDLREDLGNTLVTGNTIISHSDTTAGQINWASNPSGNGQIYLKVIGSNLSYQIAENPTGATVTLNDNEVAYITLTRDIDVSPDLVFTNGSTQVYSVGGIVWATNNLNTAMLSPGDFVKVASDTHASYGEIVSVNTSPVIINSVSYPAGSVATLVSDYTGTSTGVTGSESTYALGYYTLPGATGTARDIILVDRSLVPIGPNIVWLFLRSDDNGSVPRVYIKFMGEELEQGESRDISDGSWQQIIQYVGAPLLTSTLPAYVSAYSIYEGDGSSVLPQITSITVGAGSTVTAGEYFLISSSADARIYAVWFEVDGSGSAPIVANVNDVIEVPILSSDSANAVATKLATALTNALPFDDFTAEAAADVVTVTNNSAGTCNDASNGNVGAPFAISTTQAGTGSGNYIINDGDNLTLAIKKLDNSIGELEASLDSPTYDEVLDLVASSPSGNNQILGPISSGTNITLPLNSRESDTLAQYTVGKGGLTIYLNGQFLDVESGAYTEVGTAGTPSNQIQTQIDLVVGDELEFRFSSGGGGSSGGGVGPVGPQGPQGAAGPPGQDAAGGPINISTYTSNYSVLSSNCFLRADCTSGAITFTLPAASSVIGQIFYFKKIDASVNSMTLLASGSDLIDGDSSQSTFTQYASYSVISSGTGFDIF